MKFLNPQLTQTVKRHPSILRLLTVIVILALAWTLRSQAVKMLPIDYDEDDYLRAGQEYAHLIRTSNWSGFLEANYRPEHPPLAKIVIGVSLLSAPEKPLTPDRPTTAEPDRYLPRDLVRPARTTNAVLGWLTVALVGSVNPLAGLALATHTFTIKYVSQIMLEALPALTSFIMVLAYLQFKKSRKTGWLIASAVFLGLTAASKYLYCVIGIAILIDWYLNAKDEEQVNLFFRQAAFWGILGVVIFFAMNPYLWADPLTRLRESVFYHAGYSTSAEEVERANFPFWQQFNWLFVSPKIWHRDLFFYAPDMWIAFLAFIGLGRLWKKERVYVLWLAAAMLFLMVWPTKWPQYVLTLTVPLSFAAAEGLSEIWDQIREWWQNRNSNKAIYKKSEVRRATPWLIPGLTAFIILTVFPLIFQIIVSTTDFNAASIRDGFQGGIWRAFWQGITGQIPIIPSEGGNPNEVGFTGLSTYPFIFDAFNTGYGGGFSYLFFNIMWMVLSVVLQVGLGLGIALLLWQKGVKLGRFWQALFILPWAIPEMIGAMMWLNIFLEDWGWLYLAADKFGPGSIFGKFTSALASSPDLWLIIFLLPALWYGFPFMMLASSTGLKMIPREVYDAASMDGANALQTFRFITAPLLLPLLLPAILVRGIFAFNQFYLFQVFFFPNATLSTFSYNTFNPTGWFGGGQFATSAAINIINVLILVVFVYLFNRWSKAGEGVTHA